MQENSNFQLLVLTDRVLISNLLERRRVAAVTLAILAKDGTDSKDTAGSLIQSHWTKPST